MRGFIAASFLAAIVLFSQAAIAKCAYMSTRARFSAAADVLLVSVVDVHDGLVPLPYGLEKGTTVPGRLLSLRIIKSWKGAHRPESVVRGFTQGPRIEDSYPYTEVGTQILFFSASDTPYEIRSCNAADPKRINEVAEELDAITKRVGATRPHGTEIHASKIQRSADSDSERVWMALLKGFEGDVVYEGSDAEYAYFRLGTVFTSYHKVPMCAVYLPETFSLGSGRSYAVRFHIQEDKSIRMEGACTNYTGRVLGDLDQLRAR